MFNLGSYYYEYGGKFGSYFRRNIFVKIGSEDFDMSLNKILGNCSNTDIYRCVYAYEDKDRINDCRLYGPLYFDLDGDMDNDFDSLKSEVFRITGFLEREIGLGKNEIEIEDGFLYIIDSNRNTITYLEILALLEWFYKNHFDINNLIEKSLALDATGLNIY